MSCRMLKGPWLPDTELPLVLLVMLCDLSQNQTFWTCSGTARTLVIRHLLGNYCLSDIKIPNSQTYFYIREQKFRSCRIRRRKSLHFDSSSEELSNIFGHAGIKDGTRAGVKNGKDLNDEAIALLEPPPDYQVSYEVLALHITHISQQRVGD